MLCLEVVSEPYADYSPSSTSSERGGRTRHNSRALRHSVVSVASVFEDADPDADLSLRLAGDGSHVLLEAKGVVSHYDVHGT